MIKFNKNIRFGTLLSLEPTIWQFENLQTSQKFYQMVNVCLLNELNDEGTLITVVSQQLVTVPNNGKENQAKNFIDNYYATYSGDCYP